jgi:hypothetical protein
MPGRTPHDAFESFIESIRQAAGCMAACHVTPSPGGSHTPNVEHGWALNRGNGVTARGWHFEAAMKYLIIPFEEGYRVTTVAYRYRLARVGHDIWRLHWHPGGASDVAYPHVHAALSGTEQPANNLLSAHLPTPRMTFEQSVRWSAETGYPMLRDDYEEVLAAGEEAHLRHRTWDIDPRFPRGGGMPPG